MNPLLDATERDLHLHAYVDDQLDTAARAEVEAWLRDHPEDAARVAAWRRDAAALRTAWAWTERVPLQAELDPGQLRRRRHARQRAWMGMAAACVLALGIGGWGGWQLRDARLQAERAPMADAMAAYRLFATRDAALEYRDGDADEARLRDWLATQFHDAVALPDLRAQGLRPRGGRLLSTPEGAAAMWVYEDASGSRVALYVRPLAPRLRAGERTEDGLHARYWSQGAASYALIAPVAALARMRG